jgi:hypothetical protein
LPIKKPITRIHLHKQNKHAPDAPPQLKRLADGVGALQRGADDDRRLGARHLAADGVALLRLEQARLGGGGGPVVEAWRLVVVGQVC